VTRFRVEKKQLGRWVCAATTKNPASQTQAEHPEVCTFDTRREANRYRRFYMREFGEVPEDLRVTKVEDDE
jgi:hypothetical protein